jgi:hypothetical protein
MSITMNNWILHIIEKYASRISIWCWQKRIKILYDKRRKNK